MSTLLSIREGESNIKPGKKDKKRDPESNRALLFEKVKEAEDKMNRFGNDAIEQSLAIVSPHGINPKVKRLILTQSRLTIIGFKTGKHNRHWPLEDIVKIKRHAINHHCFTITALERKKKKIKNQKYSFEVKSEIICWRWIEALTSATTALLDQGGQGANNKSNSASHLTMSERGTLRRSRSSSAPPAPQIPLQRQGADEDDDDEEEENDPFADDGSDDEDDGRKMGGRASTVNYHQAKEKEAERSRDMASVPLASAPMPNSPRNALLFNPFAMEPTASLPQPQNAQQPINIYSAQHQHQQQHQQQQQQQQQFYTSPPTSHQQQQHQPPQQMMQAFAPQLQLTQPTSPNRVSPPTSGQSAAIAEPPRNSPSVYITTMSPPSHMRIRQDMGLLSATGTAAAPSNHSQCGAQVEVALQSARQELALRAAAQGANAVFQASFSTAFHQYGVTVLVCGTACLATMVTN